MIVINDMNDIEELLSKVDFVFIARICIEVIFYFVCLWVVKAVIEALFNKIVLKLKDHEIKRQYTTIKVLCSSIVNVVVSLFFITNILGDFGVDMKPILATAGVFGVAIGFGAKRFVEDIISGLIILLSGQLRVGDYVTVGNSTGTVEKVNLAMIKVRAYNGDVHYVRNGLVEKV
ncbi:MAG: mechanosensitive ion channel, partial [bacterium]|nr:mechanosensitive ion channel [bacterium]